MFCPSERAFLLLSDARKQPGDLLFVCPVTFTEFPFELLLFKIDGNDRINGNDEVGNQERVQGQYHQEAPDKQKSTQVQWMPYIAVNACDLQFIRYRPGMQALYSA